MANNQDMKGPIMSAVIGAVFFAVPYIGLGISALPSLGIAAVAYGAGSLLMSDNKKQEVDSGNKSFYDMLNDAKKQNAQIYGMISKVESKSLQDDIREVHDTAGKIIDTVSKNPNKLSQTQSFFNYYLPVTLNILEKYDVIENQNLNSEDIKKFMKSTENMVSKINKSFKVQLSNLYQSDMIDTDAEMKVFESMLNSEGFNDIDDFNIKND
jgi:5-bromo-4-chloroindolyl phosphate hydrolysis protein